MARSNSVGICGARAPVLSVLHGAFGGVCFLDAGHAGWHRDDQDMNWTADPDPLVERDELLRLLYAVYDTWMNKVDTYDPDGMPGIGSLLGTEGAFALEAVTDAVEPHEARIREILAGPDHSAVGGPQTEGEIN